MFLFGSGPRTIRRVLGDGRVVLLRYQIIHIFFVLQVAMPWRKVYQLATEDAAKGWSYKRITKEEATQLLNGEELKPSFWAQYSLIIFAVIFVGLIITNNLTHP